VGHFRFQCSSYDDTKLYCDDNLTPNEHDELTLFLGCEELLRKTSLVDMSSLDIDSVLQGCHLHCVENLRANTYIQNIIEDETLPNYDRTHVSFMLINEKEESSKVSSVVSFNKAEYEEKHPLKPLPPKEKKNRRRSKGR